MKIENIKSPKIGPLIFDRSHFTVIAGPCSIESHPQMEAINQTLIKNKIQLLRGGLWKLRTNPESFQGLGQKAAPLIESAKNQGLHLISEIVDPRHIDFMMSQVTAFQVGARNMYNYPLLKELAQTQKPVILKRGLSATVDEWLKASDYLVKYGNTQVVLCERGIRTFETSSRFTFDLNGALIAQEKSGLPVIVDPSHGVGYSEYVARLVFAAAAAGLDGALIEIHPDPASALSDGRQSLGLDEFSNMLPSLDLILTAIGKQRQ